MLRNYLAAALRNAQRHRATTVLIVGGLGAAFAVAVLIALFINDQLHAESALAGADRIFLIGTSMRISGQPATEVVATAPEVAALVQAAAPRLARTTRRYAAPDMLIRRGHLEGHETVDWVDRNFFSVIGLQNLGGNAQQALATPDSAAVTRRFALKYFGTTSAVGGEFTLDSRSVRIGAIIADPLPGSTFTADVYVAASSSDSPLALMERARAAGPHNLAPAGPLYSYVALNRSDEISIVRDAVSRSVELGSEFSRLLSLKFMFVPLEDLNLHTPGGPNTGYKLVIGMAFAAFLALFVAGVNFVNLMTARAGLRAKEIAVRKVAGAAQHHLMLQFLGDSALYVFGALLLALTVVELSSAYWSRLLYQPFDLLASPGLFALLLALALLFSVLAGTYPAVVLSSFSPQAALRGGPIAGAGSKLIRELLVGAQFVFLTASIIVTIVVARQMHHSTRDVLAFESSRTVVLPTDCRPSLQDEVRRLRGAEAFFCSATAPLEQFSFVSNASDEVTRETFSLSGLVVDFDFFSFYAVKPLAGRLFSEKFGSDQMHGNVKPQEGDSGAPAPISVVINESALRSLGMKVPSQAVGHVIRHILPGGQDAQVIGVVGDFVIAPVRSPIRALLFVVDMNRLRWISVRIAKQDFPGTVQSLESLWKKRGDARSFRPRLLSELFETTYHDVVVASAAFAFVSTVALIVASFGLLGLANFNAAVRAKESGIRLVMGASRFDISRMLLSQTWRPLLGSNFMAWPVGYLVSRHWLEEYTDRIDMTMGIFVMATLWTTLIAGAIVFIHSWRAARVSPALLLRHE